MKIIIKTKDREHIISGNPIPSGTNLTIGDRDFYVGGTKYEIIDNEMVGIMDAIPISSIDEIIGGQI